MDLLQSYAGMAKFGFQGLKGIGAIGQVNRGRRNAKPFQVGHVFGQEFREILLIHGLIGAMGGGVPQDVTINAPMGTAVKLSMNVAVHTRLQNRT